MREFYGVAQCGEYRVGCAGQTTYVYGADGAEIARLRDVPYAYAAAFRPDGGLLVVRSTTPAFAFYALPDFRLVRRIRMRRPNGQPQDEGFCFSPDGTRFWSLEYQNDLTTSLVCYDTESFAEAGRFFEGEGTVFSVVEPADGGGYDLLGFRREEEDRDNTYWLARFDTERIVAQTPLPRECYDRVLKRKRVELCGFTVSSLTIWGIAESCRTKAPLAVLCADAEDALH